MCRSIKPLFNFEPPATDDEVRAAALQYVRKVERFPQAVAGERGGLRGRRGRGRGRYQTPPRLPRDPGASQGP